MHRPWDILVKRHVHDGGLSIVRFHTLGQSNEEVGLFYEFSAWAVRKAAKHLSQLLASPCLSALLRLLGIWRRRARRRTTRGLPLRRHAEMALETHDLQASELAPKMAAAKEALCTRVLHPFCLIKKVQQRVRLSNTINTYTRERSLALDHRPYS